MRNDRGAVAEWSGGGLAGDRRLTFAIGYRLASRAFHLISPEGGARGRAWRGALLASAAADIGPARSLARRGTFHLLSRTALDAVDAGVWARSPAHAGNAAALPSVPLVIETAYRAGARAALLPAGAVTAAVAIGRRRAGRPFPTEVMAWHGLAIVGGLLARRHEDRQRERALAVQAETAAADRALAFLAGQSDVAVGSDTIADALTRTIPLLGPPVKGSALDELSIAWKATLADAVGASAEYLGTSLLGWQRQHNQHPDLSTHVRFDVAAGKGTVLLTTDQVAALAQRLDLLRLAGRVSVDVRPRPRDAVPGDPLTVVVDGSAVAIGADRSVVVRTFDPGPAMMLVAALYSLGTMAPEHGGAPLWSVALPAVGLVASAQWLTHRTEDHPDSAAALWASLAFTAVHSELVGQFLPQRRTPATAPPGRSFPFIGASAAPLALLEFHRDRIDPVQRALAAGALVAIAVRGWSLVPRPRPVGTAIGDAVWIAAAWIGARAYQDQFDNAAAQARGSQAGASQAEALEAYREGRQFVVAFLRRALVTAREQHAAVRSSLDPLIDAEVQRRLDEVHDRLTVLERTDRDDVGR